MGNRLSKIYTRTGDKGTTGLGDGSRIDKDHLRVEAFGTIDELNSTIGIILSDTELNTSIRDALIDIQHDLFELGGELCIPGYTLIKAEWVTRLENILDELNENLPPLKEFILPGGGKTASFCHLARTVCRRAERRTIALDRQDTINPQAIVYLNRLSDLLFVMARVIARESGHGEVLWQRKAQ